MFPAHLEKKLQENHIIYSSALELTWRCNYRCIHCYQYPQSSGELTTAEVKDIIAQLADMGCLYLSFTGGEPLLRDDFWEIAEYAREKTFALTLQTNGFLLTPDAIKRIRELSFVDVDLSLLGARPQTHDAIVGRPGSYDKVVNAIELLRKNGIAVNVKVTVIKQNFSEMKEMKALVEGFAARLVMSPLLFPMRREKNLDDLRIDDQDMRGYYRTMLPFDEIKKEEQRTEEVSFLTCQTGKTYCCINPEGKVYPCIMLPIVVGDLRQNSLEEIWHTDPSPLLGKIRSMDVSDLTGCSDCSLSAKCNRCSALSYLETGDLRSPADESCRMARTLDEVINQWKEKKKQKESTPSRR
jgi:radical SAM protein with 4Fe4S-binding SPASM domain